VAEWFFPMIGKTPTILIALLFLGSQEAAAQSTMNATAGAQVARTALPSASCQTTASQATCEWTSGNAFIRVTVDDGLLTTQSRFARGIESLSMEEGIAVVSAWDKILRAYDFTINDYRQCASKLRKSPEKECWVRGRQYVLRQWLQPDLAREHQSNFEITPSH
jgi:hypothetical protein